MSKVGENPIIIPAEVKVEIERKNISVSGKEGSVAHKLPLNIEVKKDGDKLIITRVKEDKKTKSLHGLYRSLIANSVEGVQKLWYKKLEIVGTGYSVKLEGEDLLFKVGYSHPVLFKKQEGVKFQVEGNNKIIISGVDKQLVGQITHQIRIIRKPDAYKGKGIRHENERLKLKPGKKAKTGAA